MRLNELKARLRKLEELSQLLALEAGRWGDYAELFNSVERHEYLNGLLDAMAGVEQAKGSLYRACQRKEKKK